MTDQELLAAFDDCSLTTDEFHHEVHVKLAWLHLRAEPLAAALPRFRDRLRRFTASHGRPNQYHETITATYMLIIDERMQAATNNEGWHEFVTNNPDIFNWNDPILKRYYNRETLVSEIARQQYVSPDHGSFKSAGLLVSSQDIQPTDEFNSLDRAFCDSAFLCVTA